MACWKVHLTRLFFLPPTLSIFLPGEVGWQLSHIPVPLQTRTTPSAAKGQGQRGPAPFQAAPDSLHSYRVSTAPPRILGCSPGSEKPSELNTVKKRCWKCSGETAFRVKMHLKMSAFCKRRRKKKWCEYMLLYCQKLSSPNLSWAAKN